MQESLSTSTTSASLNERDITWKALRTIYDFDDKSMASGGYGSIYVGKKLSTNESIVLKLVNIHSCAFRRFRLLNPENLEELRKYIKREWNFLSKLNHPNIIAAKDENIYRIHHPCYCGADHSLLHGKDDEIYVMIMERMDMDVYDLVHYFRDYRESPTRLKISNFGQLKHSRLPPRLARNIFYQICKALDYLHERPIIHRDISWGNIMLKRLDNARNMSTGRLSVKLVDMGLSRDLPSTQSGLSIQNIGTLAFCSPELHYSEMKTSGYGSRIDVWSLGVVLYLMLTGACDPDDRSLRFRNMIDAIENDHDECIASQRRRRCLFCEEVMNDRFSDGITPEDMNIKQSAMSLLEGMLKILGDERMSIKQVLGHEWLAEERAGDLDPGAAVDTEEETLLFTIPRRRGDLPPLRIYAKKFEYPYLRDPDCTIIASSYRDRARTVKMGDVTTLGGVLSRIGVSSGQRLLENLSDFQRDDYVICLDQCIPRRARQQYFRHAYLCLLDQPNNRSCIYKLYKSLREQVDLSDSRSMMMPLIGFDFHLNEEDEFDAIYKAALGENARKKFILHQFLSLAYHISQTTSLEALFLSSWKHTTYSLVKEVAQASFSSSGPFGPSTPFLPGPEIFEDEPCKEHFQRQAQTLRSLYESCVLFSLADKLSVHDSPPRSLTTCMEELLQLMQHFRFMDPAETVRVDSSSSMECALVRHAALVAHVWFLQLRFSENPLMVVRAGEEEEVYLSFMTLESNYEKLVFEGDEILINRVDVCRSLDSLETILRKCVARS